MIEAVKMINKHGKENILMYIQYIIVCLFALTSLIKIEYALGIESSISELLNEDIEKVIHIVVDPELIEKEDLNSLIQTAKEQSIMDNILCYSDGMFLGDVFDQDDVWFLEKGHYYGDNNEEGAVIGKELARKYGIKVGDTLQEYNLDKEFKVLGILEEGERWFDGEIAKGNILLLDNEIILYDGGRSDELYSYYYCYGNIAKINQLVADKGLTNAIQAYSLKQEVLLEYKEIIYKNWQWILLSILLILLSILGNMVVAITHIISRKKEIGIRLAVGYSKKLIIMIYSLEIAIVSFSGYLTAICASYILIGNGYREEFGKIVYSGNRISFANAMIVFLITVVMVAPSIIVLMSKLRKVNPQKYVGGKD